jgi:hypothetical protein
MMIALILPKRSFWQRKYKEIVSRFIISHQMTNLGLKKNNSNVAENHAKSTLLQIKYEIYWNDVNWPKIFLFFV